MRPTLLRLRQDGALVGAQRSAIVVE